MNGNREDVAAECGRRGINVIRLARYLSCRALFAVIMAAPDVILWQWPAEAAQVEKAALTQTPGPVTAKLPIPGKPMTVDLGPSTGSGQAPSTSSGQGGGVVMEFVWVEPLKMWVGKYEVTNGEMRRYEPKWFTGAGLRARFGDLVRKGEPVEINGDRQPVADVSWDYAKKFCRWLTEKARQEGQIGGGMEFRLPYDWEWSVAVGLDEPLDGTPMEKDGKILGEYPWGQQWPPPRGAGNYHGQEDRDPAGKQRITGEMIVDYNDGYWLSSPVGSFAPNKYGLYDMGGNVTECCEDFYNGVSGDRVLRGWGWYISHPSTTLSSRRQKYFSPDSRGFEMGFRVVCVDAARVSESSRGKNEADKKAAAEPPQKMPPAPGPAIAKGPPPGEPMTLDLGPSTGSGQAPSTSSGQDGGVVMEFVWVEPLGMRVGKYEVTNGEYRRYKADHNSGKYWIDIYLNGRCGGSLDGDRQPVVMVSWEDAKGFCRWLTEKARREGKIGGGLEYRLPHDWEWSVAVGLDEPRGGTPQEKDGKIAGENWAVRNLVGISAYYDPKEKGNIIGVYPWGTEYPPPPGAGNYCGTEGLVHGRKIAARTGYRDGYSLSSPVGSFKANQYGLYDMGGNVWEWCEDYYNGVGGRRVLRGGSYDSFSPHEMLSSFRALCDPVNRIEIGGFRVVCAAAGPLRVPAGFRAAPGTTAEPYTKTGWAQEVVHEKTGIALVFIPAGEFMMGSSASELALVGIDGKSSQHLVQIAQPFYLGKYEVTQGEWTKVMGANPSHFKGDERLPVEKVSWYDCQEFLGKAGDGLRLPAEAEWEYACRAGTTTLFSSGNTAEDLGAVAWYGVNSGGKTHVVGGKPPNAWGLYDMHGNVAEWCQEEHGQGGWGRVSRGGWWPRHGGDLDLRFSRSAYSGRDNAAGRRPYQGFRVVAAPRP